jgi:hypothetical protein
VGFPYQQNAIRSVNKCLIENGPFPARPERSIFLERERAFSYGGHSGRQEGELGFASLLLVASVIPKQVAVVADATTTRVYGAVGLEPHSRHHVESMDSATDMRSRHHREGMQIDPPAMALVFGEFKP